MCICFTGVRLFPFVCSAIERWTHLNKCVFLFFFFFIRSQQGWQLLMDVPQVYTQEEGMFSLTCFVLFFFLSFLPLSFIHIASSIFLRPQQFRYNRHPDFHIIGDHIRLSAILISRGVARLYQGAWRVVLLAGSTWCFEHEKERKKKNN